jgi:hypothetical protein
MNIVVGDWRAGFNVVSGYNLYEHTFSLPAGTHFVRTEYTNDYVGEAIPAISRNLTVRDVSVTGADVSNENDEANALAAADTYIQYGRRGEVRLALVGAEPGSQVNVQLKRHAFNWGANTHGTSTSLFSNSQYTDFFKSHFNMVVPSRARIDSGRRHQCDQWLRLRQALFRGRERHARPDAQPDLGQ